MKLACADFSFPLLPHGQTLDLIAMLGFDGVDIGLCENRGHLWPSREFHNITKSARTLKKKLAERSLKLADMFLQPANNFTDFAPNHPDGRVRKKARKVFEQCLEYTVACGGRHMTLLPGTRWKTESRRDSARRSAEELAWRLDQAKKANVTFSVECHLGSFAENPRQAKELLEMTPGLTLTLDYGHFTSQGIPDSAVEPLVKHASHFHIRGAGKGRLQSSFKNNTVDYARLLQAAKKADYRGYLGLEYVWIDWNHCNETDNLSETILFRDFFKRQMKKTKRNIQ